MPPGDHHASTAPETAELASSGAKSAPASVHPPNSRPSRPRPVARAAAAASSVLYGPLTRLARVGEKTAQKFAALGIHRVLDVLLYLPMRYEDRTRIQPIRELLLGQEAQVEGRLCELRYDRGGLQALLQEPNGDAIGLRFFHVSPPMRRSLQEGVALRCFGKVRLDRNGAAEIPHPEFRYIKAPGSEPPQPYLTPVYSSTRHLPQYLWRQISDQALAALQKEPLPEYLPAWVTAAAGCNINDALRFLHRPLAGGDQQLRACRRRLAFEELLAHRLRLLARDAARDALESPTLPPQEEMEARFLALLPYTLTGAQRRAAREIGADLARTKPMLRLLQGDVGSGKTVVAALAMLRALANGYQAALMAPTELLAEQHYRQLQPLLEKLGFATVHLSGSTRRKRSDKLAALADGSAACAVGTHALFQEEVRFSRLACVVIDEQHRFGVHQRLALRNKAQPLGRLPHQLIMTATPIPRTLTMTLYAGMNCSRLDEMPPGRLPVRTAVINNLRRSAVMERVRALCDKGLQGYWVCPFIEESEQLQCQAAEESARELRGVLGEQRVGLIHGRLPAKEKLRIMGDFQEGRLALLAATTLVEVGLDVANAVFMVVENSERFGLAQLHQLRGRVGRAKQQGYCVLLYQEPLPPHGQERLAVLRHSNDGFVIADKDLALRGPGELLGARQAGLMQFRIADLAHDDPLLEEVAQSATRLLREHPQLAEPLTNRWFPDAAGYESI